MPSRKHDNYKSKWLAALHDAQLTPTEAATQAEVKIESVEGTQLSAGRELAQLHQVLIEGGLQAVSLCDYLDETRVNNQLTFAPIIHGIDAHIGKMPSKIIARRIRDVLRLAEERIGILTAMYESSVEAVDRLTMRIDTMEIGNRHLQSNVLNSMLIGKGATPNEIDEYVQNPRHFRRISEYRSVPDDFNIILINDRNQHHVNGHQSDGESRDGDGSDSDDSVDISTDHQALTRVGGKRPNDVPV
jgi:hypothetical protein